MSAEIIGSVAAAVGRIGAILTSGNAAAAGPTTGVASSAADEVSTGICGAVLSGCCRVRKWIIKNCGIGCESDPTGVQFSALS